MRYLFDFDQRLNQTPPSAFGFQYSSASALGQGPPYFNFGGYSPIGGATSGPGDSAPASRSPVVFYQGIGDFGRGLRTWNSPKRSPSITPFVGKSLRLTPESLLDSHPTSTILAMDSTARPPYSQNCLTYGSNSTYESGQISLSHRYSAGFSFTTSYWFSKSLDYLSSINVDNSSGTGLVGENDLAQNPFNLKAEHGLPFGRNLRGPSRAIAYGWQMNFAASANGQCGGSSYRSLSFFHRV